MTPLVRQANLFKASDLRDAKRFSLGGPNHLTMHIRYKPAPAPVDGNQTVCSQKDTARAQQ